MQGIERGKGGEKPREKGRQRERRGGRVEAVRRRRKRGGRDREAEGQGPTGPMREGEGEGPARPIQKPTHHHARLHAYGSNHTDVKGALMGRATKAARRGVR
jgi:hypothetical protein